MVDAPVEVVGGGGCPWCGLGGWGVICTLRLRNATQHNENYKRYAMHIFFIIFVVLRCRGFRQCTLSSLIHPLCHPPPKRTLQTSFMMGVRESLTRLAKPGLHYRGTIVALFCMHSFCFTYKVQNQRTLIITHPSPYRCPTRLGAGAVCKRNP